MKPLRISQVTTNELVWKVDQAGFPSFPCELLTYHSDVLAIIHRGNAHSKVRFDISDSEAGDGLPSFSNNDLLGMSENNCLHFSLRDIETSFFKMKLEARKGCALHHWVP
ncbi:hypothetical protein Tco_0424244 [Tanacetum coccineum]